MLFLRSFKKLLKFSNTKEYSEYEVNISFLFLLCLHPIKDIFYYALRILHSGQLMNLAGKTSEMELFAGKFCSFISLVLIIILYRLYKKNDFVRLFVCFNVQAVILSFLYYWMFGYFLIYAFQSAGISEGGQEFLDEILDTLIYWAIIFYRFSVVGKMK